MHLLILIGLAIGIAVIIISFKLYTGICKIEQELHNEESDNN